MNELDDLDDLDEVFGPLRSEPTPAELADEATTVDLMVNAHRTSEETPMFTSRRTRIAVLVAAGVIGFGGMAAASPSLLGDTPLEDEAPVVTIDEAPVDTIEDVPVDTVEESPVVSIESADAESVIDDAVDAPEEAPPAPEEDAAEDDAAEAPAAPLVDDPATAFDETTCLPGNHGATVSAVARGEFPGDVSVTDAAHSSCGKDVDVATDEPGAEPEPDLDTEAEAADLQPTPPAQPAKAGGNGNGGRDTSAESPGPGNSNGNGNGNGNSNGRGPSGRGGG